MRRIFKWETGEGGSHSIFIKRIEKNVSCVSLHIDPFKCFGGFTLVDVFVLCSSYIGGKICKNKILIYFSQYNSIYLVDSHLSVNFVIKAHLEAKIAQLEARLDHFENLIKVKDHQHVSIPDFCVSEGVFLIAKILQIKRTFWRKTFLNFNLPYTTNVKLAPN